MQRDGCANPLGSLVALVMDETRITKQGFTHSEFLYLNSVDVVRAGEGRNLGSIPYKGIPAQKLSSVPI